MYSKIITGIGLALCISTGASSHEMTPAYPKLNNSYMEGVYFARLNLFNRREDVEYYEIEVFTQEWEPVPFASSTRVMKVKQHKRKSFEVYVKESDKDRVTYICTRSKLFKSKEQLTLVASRICSKIRQNK